MNKTMKLIGLMSCLLFCASLINAQELNAPQENQRHGKRLSREVPTPEKIATRMTNQMKEQLQLTDKQYKKIYKLNLKEQKQIFKDLQNLNKQHPPVGRLDMKNSRPPIRGGEPPMMGKRVFSDRMEGSPMMPPNGNPVNAQKKTMENKEKKIKKILTTEQYKKWQTEQTAIRKKHPQKE